MSFGVALLAFALGALPFVMSLCGAHLAYAIGAIEIKMAFAGASGAFDHGGRTMMFLGRA